jgi:pimeloyl-ACP methyl ester carboxylesterase
MTVDRPSVLEAGLIGAAVGSFPIAFAETAAAQSASKTYVLVHGAWHGGWCWKEVTEGLRGMGHRVSCPTQTGLGEREHLLSKDITLDTFVADIVNHIEAEELVDVILVGHSLGGRASPGRRTRSPTASGISSTSTALSWRTARAHSACCPPML